MDTAFYIQTDTDQGHIFDTLSGKCMTWEATYGPKEYAEITHCELLASKIADLPTLITDHPVFRRLYKDEIITVFNLINTRQ